MKINDELSVKGFGGTWIYRGDNILRQIENKQAYIVWAKDYPNTNKLEYLVVDSNKKFLFDRQELVND